MRFVRLGIVAMALVVLGAIPVRTQDFPSELQRATQREVTTGDLREVAREYVSLATRAEASNRAVAASALLRAADVYRKLGDGQARALYERVATTFPDQPAAAAARTRLGPTQSSGPSTARVLEIGEAWDRISPDGRRLARVNWDSSNLEIIDLATNRRWPVTSDGSPTEPDHRYPSASAFSRDGRQIAHEWFLEIQDRGLLRVVDTTEGATGTPRVVYDNPEVQTIAPTDWSPDGQWIAAVIRRKDQTAQIGLVNASTGALRVLETVDWSRVGGLRFSPDSSLLAYHRPASDGAFERDVFVIAIDGSRKTVAAASPGDDTVLEWTPDGNRLLVSSDRGGSFSIWSVPAPGRGTPSSFELVKSDVGVISSLGPTRDGTLYYNLMPSGSSIHVARFDPAMGQVSAPTQPIHQFKGFNSSPEWSADGRFLASASRRDIPAPINVTRSVITIFSMETGQVVREVTPAVSYGGLGRWSPDGTLFIARGADLKGRSGIVKIDALTGETTLAVPEGTCSGVPYWSAHGRSFFCFRFSDEPAIVEVDVDSGTVLRTFPGVGQGAGASPDGRYVVYAKFGSQSDGGLYLLTLATGESREILRISQPESSLGNINAATWTADSRHVILGARIKGDSGIWLLPVDGGAPRKLNVDAPRVGTLRLNAQTNQLVYSTDVIPRYEIWKMENFLPPTARR